MLVYKEILYKALLEVKSKPDKRWGICRHVSEFVCYECGADDEIDSVLDLLTEYIHKWPACSVLDLGRYLRPNVAYPVGGSAEFYSEHKSGTLWDNPRRIELLDWLIAELSG